MNNYALEPEWKKTTRKWADIILIIVFLSVAAYAYAM
jgi:hypothetical protein